jgi:hyperosmotically inducible periplasmic protein
MKETMVGIDNVKLNKDETQPEQIMGRELRWLMAAFGLGICLAAWPVGAQNGSASRNPKTEEKYQESLTRELRHQLSVLPYYSVFDNLVFVVEGDKVTLTGQVLRPTLKTNAEAAMKSIEGVEMVVNRIEVLPVSPEDDELRRAIYRAIYEDVMLAKYALQAVPAIHIIVKEGNVTLEGTVESDADRHLANSRASGVPNVKGMKNNLLVPGKESSGK